MIMALKKLLGESGKEAKRARERQPGSRNSIAAVGKLNRVFTTRSK